MYVIFYHIIRHILSLRYHTDARLIHFVAASKVVHISNFADENISLANFYSAFYETKLSCVHFVSLRYNPGGGILCVRRDFIRSHPLSSHTFTDKIMIFWSFHEIFTSAARKFLFFICTEKYFQSLMQENEREGKKTIRRKYLLWVL